MYPFETLHVKYDLFCEKYCQGAFGVYLTKGAFALGEASGDGTVYKTDHRYNDGTTGGDRDSGELIMDLDVSNVTDHRYITALVYYQGYASSGGYLHEYSANVYEIYGTIKSDYNGYNVIQDYSTRLIDN